MAELAPSRLIFDQGCPDCGVREAVLPLPIPGVPDDFDWTARDYDSFRLFLMQELAHRFPDRRRWTPADVEVVIVELLAAALDRASHALDAVQAERFLETARRPGSVRRLLALIGYDAVAHTDPAALAALPPLPGAAPETDAERVERLWRLDPARMEAARLAGPTAIFSQRRMVTLADHGAMLERHPLVMRARARLVWRGAWRTVLIAALLAGDRALDAPLHGGPPTAEPDGLPSGLWQAVAAFHRENGLPLTPVTDRLTARGLLRPVIEGWRMLGSEVFLETARAIPITFTLAVRGKPGFFRSELRQALAAVFSSDVGGFFEPGRLGFGEDLYASDIIEAAMGVEGVAVACLNRFKRLGDGYPDRTEAGFIPVPDDGFALCLNRRAEPARGFFTLGVDAGELG